MKKCSTEELREKEIINICDGSRLGHACDFEFDACDGKILALVVPGDRGIFGGCKTSNIIIPWCKIEFLGEDTILVKLTVEECATKCEKKKRRCF